MGRRRLTEWGNEDKRGRFVTFWRHEPALWTSPGNIRLFLRILPKGRLHLFRRGVSGFSRPAGGWKIGQTGGRLRRCGAPYFRIFSSGTVTAAEITQPTTASTSPCSPTIPTTKISGLAAPIWATRPWT